MIKLSDISKTFERGTPNEVGIFNHFNLEIKKNDFIIVVGSNGSGKSTLLNILAGTTGIDSGKVLLEGEDISSLKDFERSKWMARIFQNPLAGTAPELTILENFRLAYLRTKSKKFTIGTGSAFKFLVSERLSVLNMGLENKLHMEMRNLSGGQRQALTLLMAIMDETKLLLLDEPTAALDPRNAVLIMELADKVIREYGLTALLVTHQVKDVVSHGNRVIQMKEGKIRRDISKSGRDELKMSDIYEWFNE